MEKKALTHIVQNGDPVLRSVAKPVPTEMFGTKELADILKRMKVALEREQDGVAIAAPQIGISLRIFIVSHRAFAIENVDKENTSVPSKTAEDLVAINPEMTKLSRKKVKVPEGCLSVRWLYGNTLRNEKASIRAIDKNGKSFTYGGSGLVAQIFQHETDHLNGTLFIDHATDIEELSQEEIEKIQRSNTDAQI